jgi:hypothetical protein
MTGNIKAVSDAIPAGTGIFFGYDEMRHTGSCQVWLIDFNSSDHQSFI